MKFSTTSHQFFGILVLAITLAAGFAQAEGPPSAPQLRRGGFGMPRSGGFGGGGRFGPPGFGRSKEREAISARFDVDGNGKLSAEERRLARQYVRGGSSLDSQSRSMDEHLSKNAGIQKDVVASRASAIKVNTNLYDEKILRTLFLRFPQEDWYEEMQDFYGTDVDVPADLIVDGKVYSSVGVRFRGSSSYRMIGGSEKKSFNIAIDQDDENQRLYGYKTLNLLNSNSDPTFMREVLYSRICRYYLPAPKANFVKLVINGENWGVYVNVQQFNKDFLKDWYGTKEGIRWKIPVDRSGGGGLFYNGQDPENYKRSYQLKTKDRPKAWADLIKLCKILDETPDAKLEKELSTILDIDETLWYLALENVFIDNDGYISRASDYTLYQDSYGRFHMIPYDNNEAFSFAGGFGPNDWPSDDPMLSPVAFANGNRRPLIGRLLSIPNLRARYLAHYRTIVNEWLDWGIIGPIVAEYKSLIGQEVETDSKKLYSYEAFVQGTAQKDDTDKGDSSGSSWGFHREAPSIKKFVEERRSFLINHSELNRPAPIIRSVSIRPGLTTDKAVKINTIISGDLPVDSVLLFYSANKNLPFKPVEMTVLEIPKDAKAQQTTYTGEIPIISTLSHMHYYIEARLKNAFGTTSFWPSKSEGAVLTYRRDGSNSGRSPVVINELMARNTKSYSDPQGEFDDWIELFNRSERKINLSGMYLSDSRDNLRKWIFPENTILPSGGYLIIWPDKDNQAKEGLHAGFKISKNGEGVFLTDSDERGNQLLDSIEFNKQRKDTAIGRYPNGTGDFRPLRMTPGKRNRP